MLCNNVVIVSVATNNHAITGELLEVMFSIRSVPNMSAAEVRVAQLPVLRQYNMTMNPTGLRIKNDCAGKG
jgi:hypothetical protein